MGLILMYLTAIVAANLLVAQFGASVTVFNAFVFIALDLTARDGLHDLWHGRGLRWKMATLIGVGSALSALLNINALPIAVASFAAFAAAGVIDTLVYAALGNRSRFTRMNGSNLFSAAVDSVVFPVLAFGFPPLWGIVAGQFAAKVIGGVVWSWLLTGGFARVMRWITSLGFQVKLAFIGVTSGVGCLAAVYGAINAKDVALATIFAVSALVFLVMAFAYTMDTSNVENPYW